APWCVLVPAAIHPCITSRIELSTRQTFSRTKRPFTRLEKSQGSAMMEEWLRTWGTTKHGAWAFLPGIIMDGSKSQGFPVTEFWIRARLGTTRTALVLL